jgi:hypothetical protein
VEDSDVNASCDRGARNTGLPSTDVDPIVRTSRQVV